jgi:hypothetical protein
MLRDTDPVLQPSPGFGLGMITALVQIDGVPFGLIAKATSNNRCFEAAPWTGSGSIPFRVAQSCGRQSSKCFYHRGTRENDRARRADKFGRFARCVVRLLREAPESLLLRVLRRPPLFLRDKNTYFLAFWLA